MNHIPAQRGGLRVLNSLARRRGRVDLQVSLLTAALVLLSCGLVFFVNYQLAYHSMIQELHHRATQLSAYLEERLSLQAFTELNARGDEGKAAYDTAKRQLEAARQAAGLRYLYTAKADASGALIYLVDGLPTDSADFRHAGDPIEPECVPDLMRALGNEAVLPKSISSTSWGYVFISYFPFHDKEGAVVGAVGMEFDAREQYEAFYLMTWLTPLIILAACLAACLVAVRLFKRISNPTFHDLATTDLLTGLKNRNAFEVAIQNLNQSPVKPSVSLVSIDLDDLKIVNDTQGHAAGDQYLKTACRLIQQAAPPDAVYRTGGDEFAAILKDQDAASLDALLHAIERAARQLEQGGHPVGLSCGYALFDPASDKSLYDTLRRADAQMYARKRIRKGESG